MWPPCGHWEIPVMSTNVTTMWHSCDTYMIPMWHPCNNSQLTVTHLPVVNSSYPTRSAIPVMSTWHQCAHHVAPMWHTCDTHVIPMWHLRDTYVTSPNLQINLANLPTVYSSCPIHSAIPPSCPTSSSLCVLLSRIPATLSESVCPVCPKLQIYDEN